MFKVHQEAVHIFGIPKCLQGKKHAYKKVDIVIIYIILLLIYINTIIYGDRGGTVVKVLRYKSEGRWFDSRWFHWNFSLT